MSPSATFCACAALLSLALPAAAQAGDPPRPAFTATLLSRVDPSTDGTVDLAWQVPGAAEDGDGLTFQVEESVDGRESVVLDAGTHRALSLSGRDDGTYRFRVRAARETGDPGPWSEPFELRVSHHPPTLTYTLFSIGAAVFLATVALLALGSRAAHRGSHGEPR